MIKSHKGEIKEKFKELFILWCSQGLTMLVHILPSVCIMLKNTTLIQKL